ncbi:2-oxo acid dehydrogenase subunit E2 [Areca yellow leaf disease phytoplasma]|uniref:2-oxo acid dehydrogenase subunit E2 n=1 Tax=Areca yellow leaf disease phytoplasma TaxID=927614 RepID=UPI0035B52244
MAALQEFPVFNASYDDVKEEVTYKKFINLGVAVDTKDGLIAPTSKYAIQQLISFRKWHNNYNK